MEMDVQRQKIMKMMGGLEGACIREKAGSSMRFRMYLTKDMKEASIDVLELMPRSVNCLRRANIHTVGTLVQKIGEGLVLTSIRNLGKTSERDIMQCLFLYQYNSLPESKREDYLYEILRINVEAGTAKVDL